MEGSKHVESMTITPGNGGRIDIRINYILTYCENSLK